MKKDTLHIVYGRIISSGGAPIDSLYYSKFYYLNPSSFSSAKEFIDIFQNIYISNKGSFVFYKDTLHLVVQTSTGPYGALVRHYKRINRGTWIPVYSDVPQENDPALSVLGDNLLLFTNTSIGIRVYLLNQYGDWGDVTYIPQKKMDYVYSGG
ncbi:MAG: hypothetical protein QXM39_05235 [Thermoplasmata archaeon]